jgi:hypothetical protein
MPVDSIPQAPASTVTVRAAEGRPHQRPPPFPDTPQMTADLTFWDLLDVVNPLQHLPIISTIYRELTGDEIHGTARIMGGALYGGVVGLVSGIANAVIDEATGKDIGEHAIELAFGDSDEADGLDEVDAVVAAQAAPADPAAPAAPAPAPAAGEAVGATLSLGPPVALSLLAMQETGAAAPPATQAALPIESPAGPAADSPTGPQLAADPAPGAAPPQPLAAGARLDAALMALAIASEGPAPGAARSGNDDATDEENAAAGGAGPAPRADDDAHGLAVPPQQVPEAMARALALYQQQAAARTAAAGLDSRL